MQQQGFKLILASKSPRRQELLRILGWDFEIKVKEVEEVYPSHLKKEKVALYLSELKAKAFQDELSENTVVITADTIVCIDDLILGKPNDIEDAKRMLRLLSGRKHEVITAVSLQSQTKQKSFYVLSDVYFKPLTEEEINYYLETWKPFDKAGSYGVQDWMGLVGMEKINGSYYNVMGLPVKELYEALLAF